MMKNLKSFAVFVLLVLMFNSPVFAQVFSFERYPSSNTATFPAGTLFKGILQNQLSSAKSKIGDKVYLMLPFDVKIGEMTCIPAKSMLIGQVIQVQKAREGNNGFIQVKFEYIKFPDGWGTPLEARVWDRNGQGIIGGELTHRIAYKKIPHNIENIGRVAQLVETGKRAMGKEKIIPVGSEFVIVLDSDLEVVTSTHL